MTLDVDNEMAKCEALSAFKRVPGYQHMPYASSR